MILNILIIHEIDWINKVVFEPHHFAELFSKKGHNVFVMDCPDVYDKKIFSGLNIFFPKSDLLFFLISLSTQQIISYLFFSKIHFLKTARP